MYMLRGFTENKSAEIQKLLRARTSVSELKTTILWKLGKNGNGNGSGIFWVRLMVQSFCGDYALEHL